MPGKVVAVLVAPGAAVERGQGMRVVEAMEMENEITAHKAGTIAELAVKEGEPIASGAPIATITSADAE
jgi:biotin carboxyl carrier protein